MEVSEAQSGSPVFSSTRAVGYCFVGLNVAFNVLIILKNNPH